MNLKKNGPADPLGLATDIEIKAPEVKPKTKATEDSDNEN